MSDLNRAQYHKIYVGLTEADIDVDIGRLKTIISAMLTQIGVGSSVQGLDEHIHEVTRHIHIMLFVAPTAHLVSSDLSLWWR